MKEVLDAINALGQEMVIMKHEMTAMKQEMVTVKQDIFDMREEFNQKLDNTRIEFTEKLEDTKNELKQEISETKKELEQKILDTRFNLEQQYGEKINSMYDVLVMEKDKEYDNHKDIEKLDNRLTRAEANIFKQGEDFKVLTQTI